MTPAEILKAARAKIEKPENWCQWFMAKMSDGFVTTPNDENACRWCSFGATLTVQTTARERRLALDFLRGAAIKLEFPDKQVPHTGFDVTDFNDTHTHPEVLQMFDLAIEKAEGRG